MPNNAAPMKTAAEISAQVADRRRAADEATIAELLGVHGLLGLLNLVATACEEKSVRARLVTAEQQERWENAARAVDAMSGTPAIALAR